MTKEKGILRKGRVSGRDNLDLAIIAGLKESWSLYRKPPKVYASDAGYCPRRAVKFFVATGTDAITARSRAYMKIGVAIHELITMGLNGAGLLIYEEFRLPRRRTLPDIRGIIDIIHFDQTGEIWGMEIKSCGVMPSSPKPEHIKQAQIYSAISGFPFRITYLSRHVAGREQKLMIRSFEIDCSKEALVRVLTNVCTIHMFWDRGLLPPIPEGFTPNSCKWCPFKEQCWKEEEERLARAPVGITADIYEIAEMEAKKLYGNRKRLRNRILKKIASNPKLKGQKRLAKEGW